MPQMQLSSGPQDALLQDNTKSYFTNVGYVRTSNFQMELKDVDPQNAANLGATVNFVIPKAADLLGPLDLQVEFNEVEAAPGNNIGWGWVESVGYAMIEKVTFSIGTHEIETLTGDHLNIINELMRKGENRHDQRHIGRTGRPLLRYRSKAETTVSGVGQADAEVVVFDATEADTGFSDRLIAFGSTIKKGKKLTVPLGLFFSKHPSAYFPICAIAGANEIRVSIKFRQINELLCAHAAPPIDENNGEYDAAGTHVNPFATKATFVNGSAFKVCRLRGHFFHVTGPEATALMSREHVRLMKIWNSNQLSKQFTVTHKTAGNVTAADHQTLSMDLSFMHPVAYLVITVRKVSEMGSSLEHVAQVAANGKAPHGGVTRKNYFAYQGGAKPDGVNVDDMDSRGNFFTHSTGTKVGTTYLDVKNFKLMLNGQSRHLDGQGLDREYLQNRLMPMMHSGTNTHVSHIHETSMTSHAENDFHTMAELLDRKDIFVFPFSLAPESANPSGSVNFSKVSHAKLDLLVSGMHNMTDGAGTAVTSAVTDDYQVDVYGVNYNWLALKDGRGHISFA